MKQNPLIFAAGAFLVGATFAIAAPAFRKESSATQAARAFLATLEADKAQKARYPFGNEERYNWHFIPKERNGLPYKEMSALQQQAALALLKTGVSSNGVKRLETLRQMENVLKEIEQGKGPLRDPDRYFFTVFGEPSDKGVWGWRYEGHHVSLQWTVRDGKVIADTPQFLGANPAEVREGAMKGTRILAKEEDLGFDLIKSLNAEQQKEAIINTVAPNEIVTSNSRKAAIEEDKGIAFATLTKPQQKLLETLVVQHASLQAPDFAAKRLTALRHVGWETVKFAWMGGLEKGQGHYYRIQGKTFLIEFDNTQNNANHIHTAWRDFKGDFGTDLLALHYQNAPHRNTAIAH